MSRRNDTPRLPVEITIERTGFRGDGIATHDDGLKEREILVPFALPGERWLVRLVGRDGKRWRARGERMIEASPSRCKPVCDHFGRCGGCVLQHVGARDAADLKIAMIEGALRSRGLDHPPFEAMATSPPSSRRRIRIAIDRNGRVGFRERWSRRIEPVSRCPVAHPDLERLLTPLAAIAPKLGCLAHECEIQFTRVDNGIDMHWLAGDRPSPADLELTTVTLSPLGVLRTSWSEERSGFAETLWQRDQPMVVFGEHSLPFPPGCFMQATAEGLTSLQQFVDRALSGSKRICDLFSGLGSLSLPLLHRLDHLCAIDSNEPAIRSLSGVPGVRAIARDLHSTPFSAPELERFDAVILDPPRSGGEAQAEEIAKSSVRRVVHVSCNPASFARDTERLAAAGFRIARLLPVDQFTHAAAVELAALLLRD
ncbi:MAG: hypothetical protein R3C97_03310 [Geminicoccaceae bacterium]